ncbi:MAG: hypothetical protein HRU19_11875 [Pseudobacteriovorax sp.]|nr:hypothetical protein [Pseudobacteriovorax sp.]
MRLAAIFLSSTFLAACNVNSFLATEKQRDAIDLLLAEAQYEYDKGRFNDALTLANEAYVIDPTFEQTNVQLGFIYLGRSGVDIFSLSKNIINESDGEQTTGEETNSLFTTLSSVIGVDATEIDALSTEKTNSLSGIDIYLPKTASEARASESQVISDIDLAVQFLCPFVDETAKLVGDAELEDPRHAADVCAATTAPRYFDAKANFAWGLAHLGEAVAFYSVLFYTDPGESTANLLRGVNSLDANTEDTSAYLASINALTETVEAIFPTSSEEAASDSMLNAMFNNLETTSLAFGAAGAPRSFTKSIDKAITGVKNTSSEITNTAENSKALKAKLTKGLSRKLETQIESLGAGADIEELADICDQYSQINENAPLPDNCP